MRLAAFTGAAGRTDSNMPFFARSALAAAILLLPSFATSRSPEEPNAPIVALQPHPSQPEWSKVCPSGGEQKNCYVTRDFVDTDGSAIMAIGVYTISGKQDRIIGRVLLPLGLSLPAGIRIAIDNAPPVPGQFSSCIQTGCFVEFPIGPEFAQTMRKGDAIRIAALNQYQAEIGFLAPLSGLAAALDGPPLTDAALAHRQDNLRRKLHEKAQQR